MKHAYMIIAHNEFSLLEKQMRLLDDPRNDFYIHIDKKVKDFPFDTFHSFLKHSHVYYVDRMDIRWGDFSMALTELVLLKAAIQRNYRYYHLLSGIDMPLKSNDEIHDFFCEHDGMEFIQCGIGEGAEKMKYRVERHHTMRMRSSKYKLVRLARPFIHGPIWVAHALGIKRKWDPKKTFAYGSQWFSITHDLACYVLGQEKWIRRYFHHSNCSDEHFIQTLAYNSSFREKLYMAQDPDMRIRNMRLIDWKRSDGWHPYTFTSSDFEELTTCPYLFARKFSTKQDPQIIERLYCFVREKNEQKL